MLPPNSAEKAKQFSTFCHLDPNTHANGIFEMLGYELNLNNKRKLPKDTTTNHGTNHSLNEGNCVPEDTPEEDLNQ